MPTTNPTNGNDTIAAIDPNEALNIDALDGNDRVTGGDESDVLIGNDGNDSLVGLGGIDNLYGGQGTDSLYGGAGDDAAFGDAGSDDIEGGEGSDLLVGGDELDSLDGGDTIDGGNGSDTLRGGFGADSLTGGAGNDSLYGGVGNDIIVSRESTTQFDDSVSAGNGDDVIRAGYGDTVDGGAGNDVLELNFSRANARLSAAWEGDSVTGGFVYTITDASAPQGTKGITVRNVERVKFSDDGTKDSALTAIRSTSDQNLIANGDFEINGLNLFDRVRFPEFDGWRGSTRVFDTSWAGTYLEGYSAIEKDIATIAGQSYVLTLTIGGWAGGPVASDVFWGGARVGIAASQTPTWWNNGQGTKVSFVVTGAANEFATALALRTAAGAVGNIDLLSVSLTVGSTLTASASADALVGGASAETISGLGGNDTLSGGAGNDTLYGDDEAGAAVPGGRDTASYAYTTTGVNVQLGLANTVGLVGARGGATVNGGNDTDTLWSIENVIGGSGNDTIVGNEGANRLEGDAGDDGVVGAQGNDVLVGGAGRDTLTGGAVNDTANGGNDTVTYAADATAIQVEVGSQLVVKQTVTSNGVMQTVADTLYDIENVRGTKFADTFVAPLAGMRVTLDGGEGSDVITFEAEATGVSVNLSNLRSGNLSLRNIESIKGSGFDDTLTGSASANRIEGGSGIDVIKGRGGNDNLMGGAGNDRLESGKGKDTLIGGAGDDTLVVGTIKSTSSDSDHLWERDTIVMTRAGGNDTIEGFMDEIAGATTAAAKLDDVIDFRDFGFKATDFAVATSSNFQALLTTNKVVAYASDSLNLWYVKYWDTNDPNGQANQSTLSELTVKSHFTRIDLTATDFLWTL